MSKGGGKTPRGGGPAQVAPAAAPSGALAVEYRAIESLTPYARNARTHTDAQVDQIAASIREFGWTKPLIVDERGCVLAGHGALAAAKRLGLERVPVIQRVGLSEEQKRAYLIADNKLSENSAWDNELLAVELDELRQGQFDLALLGFTDEEIARLLPDGGADQAEVREIPVAPVLDSFWISVRGPLAKQAEALQRLQAVMEPLGLEVELGTVNREAE